MQASKVTAAPTRRRRMAVWQGVAFAAGLLVLALPVRGRAERPPEPPQPPQQVLVSQAFGAIAADDFERARTLTQTVHLEIVSRTLDWFRLIAQRQGGDYREYVAFMRANPDWPYQYTLQYRAEGVMPADLPHDQVRAFFENRAPASPYGAERYADALISAGKEEAARSVLRHAWLQDDFPYSDEAGFLQRYGHLIDQDLHAQRLERLLWERKFDAAERQAKRVDADLRALARARTMLARREDGVDAAIDRVPADLRDHPGLVFERALWRKRSGRYEETVELLAPPRPDAPYPAEWWSLRHWAARTALDKGDISLAYRLAANHGLESGLGFAEGEWLAGWIALRWLREPATALPHFERLHGGVSTPVSRARGAYWAGRAAEAAGQDGNARRWFETAATNLTTFYGQLAADRLNSGPMGGDIFLALPRKPQPAAAERMAFAADELVRAVRQLAELGQQAMLDRLLSHLAGEAETPERTQMVADLAERSGRPDLAVRIARKARRDGMILPDHLYPVVDLPHTLRGAQDENALVLAIVRQESGFDAGAVSRTGARGMMQLMPATAKAVAARLDLDYRSGRLFDPEFNLTLGSTYLGGLISRYDGSLLLAVAAYNAGPSRVNRWLDRYGDPREPQIDPIDWVESLPFAETRNYVQRVFESLMIYRHRLAPTQVALALDARLLLDAGGRGLGGREQIACCL